MKLKTPTVREERKKKCKCAGLRRLGYKEACIKQNEIAKLPARLSNTLQKRWRKQFKNLRKITNISTNSLLNKRLTFEYDISFPICYRVLANHFDSLTISDRLPASKKVKSLTKNTNTNNKFFSDLQRLFLRPWPIYLFIWISRGRIRNFLVVMQVQLLTLSTDLSGPSILFCWSITWLSLLILIFSDSFQLFLSLTAEFPCLLTSSSFSMGSAVTVYFSETISIDKLCRIHDWVSSTCNSSVLDTC